MGAVANKEALKSMITVPSEEIPVMGTYDVVVAGGGVAGIIAAIAAARVGARTALAESNSFLGGTATAAMMTSIVASNQAGGIGLELMRRMAEAGGAPAWEMRPDRTPSTPFEHEVYKRVALEMMEEAGVDLWLYTSVVDPVMEGRSVTGVRVLTKSGLAALLGKVTIDATGDADVAAKAGAKVYKGRESDGSMRPFALLFRIGGLDLAALQDWALAHPDQIQPQYRQGTVLEVGEKKHVISRISGFYDLVDKAKSAGVVPKEINYFRLEACWLERNIALCNTTRIYGVDGTNPRDLTKGEIIGRRQIESLMRFVVEYLPGGAGAYLLDVAPRLGVRETRRIISQEFVTDDDFYGDRPVDDPIATLGGWFPARTGDKAIDVHMPEPVEGSAIDLLERDPDSVPREYHEIRLPYGVLVPVGPEQLLVAGRSIGVSHRIDGYTRNQVIAMRMGQVAGAAAALSVRLGVAPSALPYDALKTELAGLGMSDMDTASVGGAGHLEARRRAMGSAHAY